MDSPCKIGLQSAETADRLRQELPATSQPRQHRAAIMRTRRQLPLFAQFPPASLFKAIGRAVSRRAMARQAASGTAIANGRLWRAAGGP